MPYREFDTADEYERAKNIYNRVKFFCTDSYLEHGEMFLTLRTNESIRHILNFDASDFPNGLNICLDTNEAIIELPNLHVSCDVVRENEDEEFELQFACFFDIDKILSRDKVLKILNDANANSKSFGLIPDKCVGSIWDETFYSTYAYAIRPAGNLFTHFEEGLKRVRLLLEQTYANVKTDLKQK